jgi:hypothetical protein
MTLRGHVLWLCTMHRGIIRPLHLPRRSIAIAKSFARFTVKGRDSPQNAANQLQRSVTQALHMSQ